MTGKIKCNARKRPVPIGRIQMKSQNISTSRSPNIEKTRREDRTRNQNRRHKTRRRMSSFEKIRGVSSKRRRRVVAARNVTRRQHFLADEVFTKNRGRGFSRRLVVDRSPVVKYVFLMTDPIRRRVPIKTLSRCFVSR